jgi:ligand-binding sensor domain-containing protein
LWFGTFNGLVRFDGARFKVFDSRTPGLESERVLRLFVDRQGGMWISMEQGNSLCRRPSPPFVAKMAG